MSYFIVIRGPAAVGKTVIAKKLSKHLKAFYISFDKLMKKNKLDVIKGEGIPARKFIKANQLILPEIKKRLSKNQIVILDGCFYRKSQLTHLVNSLNQKYYIFSLKATLNECLSRNRTRKMKLTEKSVKAVYKLVSRTNIGIKINTSGRTASQIVANILKYLPDENS